MKLNLLIVVAFLGFSMSVANKIDTVKKSVQKRLAQSVEKGDVCASSGIYTTEVMKMTNNGKEYSCQYGKTVSVTDVKSATAPPVATTKAPTTKPPTPFLGKTKLGNGDPCSIISGSSTLTIDGKTYQCVNGKTVSSGAAAGQQQQQQNSDGGSGSSRPVASFAAIALSVLFALH